MKLIRNKIRDELEELALQGSNFYPLYDCFKDFPVFKKKYVECLKVGSHLPKKISQKNTDGIFFFFLKPHFVLKIFQVLS